MKSTPLVNHGEKLQIPTPKLHKSSGIHSRPDLLKESDLGWIYHSSRRFQIEVRDLVHFWKLGCLSGAWRPFHLEGVAFEVAQIHIGFDCPGPHDFAALLFDGHQLDKLAADLYPEFLAKISYP